MPFGFVLVRVRVLVQLVVVGLRGRAAGRDDTVVMRGFVLRDIWGLPRALALAAGRAQKQKHGSNAI